MTCQYKNQDTSKIAKNTGEPVIFEGNVYIVIVM